MAIRSTQPKRQIAKIPKWKLLDSVWAHHTRDATSTKQAKSKVKCVNSPNGPYWQVGDIPFALCTSMHQEFHSGLYTGHFFWLCGQRHCDRPSHRAVFIVLKDKQQPKAGIIHLISINKSLLSTRIRSPFWTFVRLCFVWGMMTTEWGASEFAYILPSLESENNKESSINIVMTR